MDRVSRMKRKKRRGRILKTVILIIAAMAGLYVGKIYNRADQAVEDMYQHVEVNLDTQSRGKPVQIKKSEPINVLLLGADTDKDRDRRGLSDSIMLASLNPQKKSSLLVSLPRDTYIEMGTGDQNKLNAAYAMGGASKSIEVVSQLLNIKIDRYAAVDMDGLVKVIDILGGIELDNDFSFELNGYSFDEGRITLSGEEVMMYVRMRYDDPRGDYGRQERQRQVIKAIIDKALSLETVLNYEDLFQAVSQHVITNFTFDEIKGLITSYLVCGQNVKTDQLQGEEVMIDDLSFQIVSDEEIDRVHNLITDHNNND